MTASESGADLVRARVEARFKVQEQRAPEARKALEEVRAAKTAEAAKTTRLRALRLAKEEEDRIVAEAAAAEKLAKKRKR